MCQQESCVNVCHHTSDEPVCSLGLSDVFIVMTMIFLSQEVLTLMQAEQMQIRCGVSLHLIWICTAYQYPFYKTLRGWSGGAMVLGKLPVPGRLTNLERVGQGPSVLAVGAGGGCLGIFFSSIISFFLSPSLWETAR